MIFFSALPKESVTLYPELAPPPRTERELFRAEIARRVALRRKRRWRRLWLRIQRALRSKKGGKSRPSHALIRAGVTGPVSAPQSR
ncbi:hypothetical protein SAMN05216224_10193 [Thioclava dalianensis]|nr:hypothetical protein SAMN05216224_10193 [Thioclava dalianensis]